jgi:hypothetical protein
MRQRFQIKAKQSQGISHATSIRVTGELPDDSISIKEHTCVELEQLKEMREVFRGFYSFDSEEAHVQSKSAAHRFLACSRLQMGMVM